MICFFEVAHFLGDALDADVVVLRGGEDGGFKLAVPVDLSALYKGMVGLDPGEQEVDFFGGPWEVAGAGGAGGGGGRGGGHGWRCEGWVAAEDGDRNNTGVCYARQ